MTDNISLALTVLVSTSISALVVYKWVKSRLVERPKGDWKRIGTISNLYIYPMKSSRYKLLSEAETTEKGLREIRNDGFLSLRDRGFVAFREDTNQFITGRTYHNLIGITINSVSPDMVEFSCEGIEPLKIKVPTEFKNEEVKMWNDEEIPTVDCGDEASKWITKLLGVEKPLRIGYWPDSILTRRNVKKFHKERTDLFNIENEYSGTYSDLSSFLIINESSVVDINSKLPPGSTLVSHKNFRPNIHISGPEAFDEDKWKWLKIGENAVFRVFCPCTRCSFTTINPETKIKDKNLEPIKTLKTYRVATEEKQKKVVGTTPFMGVYASLYKAGNIAVGDSVYLSD
ncbi:mitochondrial amidoxime reducing component 2-like [Cimex lectularius]|uniref:MOSC domain-containing protein n=1 Tax=Cimex lectularius TaxID=79782 RepID=A0A8I6RP57_CIMLE|nr:mitochondrial amidoxime reducing component 2-like [Cimex lectularius]XP_014248553.1 mitochondrial amidoxime reducing component 2-like [Cimex lectularius]